MCQKSDFVNSYVIYLSFMNKNFVCYISVKIPFFVQFTKKKMKGDKINPSLICTPVHSIK